MNFSSIKIFLLPLYTGFSNNFAHKTHNKNTEIRDPYEKTTVSFLLQKIRLVNNYLYILFIVITVQQLPIECIVPCQKINEIYHTGSLLVFIQIQRQPTTSVLSTFFWQYQWRSMILQISVTDRLISCITIDQGFNTNYVLCITYNNRVSWKIFS